MYTMSFYRSESYAIRHHEIYMYMYTRLCDFTRNYFFFLANEWKISLKPLEVLLLFLNQTVNLNEKNKNCTLPFVKFPRGRLQLVYYRMKNFNLVLTGSDMQM